MEIDNKNLNAALKMLDTMTVTGINNCMKVSAIAQLLSEKPKAAEKETEDGNIDR